MILDGRAPEALAEAARALARGELVGVPTETVYGLGARADEDFAVARIFAAKGRPADHPLIVHVCDAEQARAFASEMPEIATRLMNAFWPGPLTIIVPRAPHMAAAAAGGQASVGLRCPAHPVARALLAAARELGVPGMAAPSANRFGRVSPTHAEHVAAEFGPELLVLDGGHCEVGIESTIVDCSRGEAVLLRPGMITPEQLEAVLARPLKARDTAAPRASGTLEAHYAPSATVRLFTGAGLREALGKQLPPALAVYSRSPIPALPLARSMPQDAAAAAHELFAVLRELDAAGAREIWIETPPPGSAWDGVRDRLTRAAAAFAPADGDEG
ncbi:MAG: threonylcarbamoyl-AMP synthase [Paucibacter sp.]|nr:threonylcarbamoyl-AMP synthase [Roseateles sp.]